MNELEKLVPPKYAVYIPLVYLAITQAGRVYHALSSGGGLRGIFNGLLFGTNVPKDSIVLVSNEKSLS